MKRALTAVLAITVAGMVVLATLAMASITAAAQTGAAAPKTRAIVGVLRAADGHPDLSGVWWAGNDAPLRPLSDAPRPTPAAPTPGAAPAPPRQPRASFVTLYQPWAKEKAKTLSDKDDPSLRCVPVAFGTLNVSLYGVGFIGQIVQSPKFVVMMTETYHSFKIIPTDGRPHRDDVAPSYRGDSVGHWEGDTLVVDTTNFTDANWMHAEGLVSFHSDALHIVERYRRTDANTIEVEATVEDPKVLTGPWIVPKQSLRLAPFDQIMEVGCSGVETAGLMEAASKVNYGKK
ncbi:MAG: hypothetical protein ABJA98_30640 [Acidobacteriota bacterium]